MFDVGFWELTVIGIVALVIVGPERLPGLARTVGLWVGKGRRMLADVKRDIDRELKASETSELGNIRKEIEGAGKEVKKVSESVQQQSGVDDLKGSFKDTFKDVAPVGESLKSDLKEIEASANEVADEAKKASRAVDDQAKAAAGAGSGVSPATPASSAPKSNTNSESADS